MLNNMEHKNDIYHLFEKAFAYQSDIGFMKSLDTDKAYEVVIDAIHHRERKKKIWQLFYRVAAIIVLPLLLSTATFFFLYLSSPNKPIPISRIESYSPNNMLSKVILPDSTVVWLNSNSKISYPSSFDNENREVSLSGEGYFSVHSDIHHPFFVNLGNGLQVMAHGTRFNVCSYQQENTIEMTLEEGAIDIILKGKTISKLIPGEQGIYDRQNGSYHQARIATEEYNSWKDNRLVFKNMPLEKVFIQLSRRYNTAFRLHNMSNHRYRIRATFENEDLSQILNYIKQIVPISWETASKTTQQEKKEIDVYIK